MLSTHILHMVVVVGVENNGKDGEGSLQDGKLDGAKFEQEERASGDETEETISLFADDPE